jgi:hydroxypyruvate isomerase
MGFGIVIAMPRFAANLAWLFTEQPFLERFEAARRAGFDAVEFPAPYDHSADDIARQLREHRLACVLFNMPMGDKSRGDFGFACRPHRDDEFRAGVALALDYAQALRPTLVNCIAGVAAAGEDRAELEALLVRRLRFAADALRAAKLHMVIEPLNDRDVPGFVMPRCDDAARVIDAVGADNLGLQCDLYHAAMMGDDPSSILARHRGIIRHIQFADVPGRGEPGSGTLPLAEHFAAIDALGYQGWVSAEYRPSRRTEQTLHWMRARA